MKEKKLEDLKLSIPQDWRSFNEYRKKKNKGFSTGISAIDDLVRGLSGIVGIQGAPGSCKSTMALQIASYNAGLGNPILIVDRENGKNRFRTRLLAQVCSATQEDVERASDDELRAWIFKLSKMPLYVETEPCSAEEIRAYLSQMWELYKRPMLLVVDSLQALPRFGLEERAALEAWLGALDQLKLDFEGRLVIIMTSEKRRGVYKEHSNDAGKGTGNVEFKCELLFDLRPGDSPGVILVALVKNRDGACFEGVALRQVLREVADPNSFLYRLEEGGQVDEY